MTQINTKKYKDLFQEVWIDDREGKRIDYGMEQYAPLNPSVKHLDYGDYIFMGHNGIKVAWEYKTGSDWLNSINSEDNHLHNQVYDMITSEDYSFIMIECEDMKGETDQLYYASGISISLPQIDGAIAEFSMVSSVLQTQTQYQAFDLMFRLSAKIIQQKPYCYKYGKKDKNTALNYLSAIKGLNNKAILICDVLDLKTLNDLLNLTVEDLCTVKGIGRATAEKIISEIGE